MRLPDFSPPERWQHGTRQFSVAPDEEESGHVVARVVEECLLDALRTRRIINATERAAGLKLRHAFIRARIEPPRTGKYDAAPRQAHRSYVGFTRTAREEEAYAEWRAAMHAVPLHSINSIFSVCCIGDMCTPKQIPRLRAGLEALIRYYENC